MEDTSFSSQFALELDQSHDLEEPTHGGIEVNATNYEPNPRDQQLPEPAQPAYQARQSGPTQFGPKSPQLNSMFPNAGSNRPPPFPLQRLPAQPVLDQPVQTTPVHPTMARLAVPNPTRTINPPVHDPTPNMGLPFDGSPNPVHQTMTFFPTSSSELGGIGGMPGYVGGPMPVQLNGAAYGIPVGTESWRTGLFNCMEDPMNAVTTAFFPCVTFGQVAEIIDDGNTTCAMSGLMYGAIAFCIAIPCILSCTYRTKMRSKFGLVETPAPDWVTHFLCECCALCQEYRELRHRGLDPAIGYQGNVARMHAAGLLREEVNMTPPVHPRMMP